MRVIVINKGVKRPSKYDYGTNRRVTFKNIDSPKQYVYLNLTEAHGVFDTWNWALKEGNILDVSVNEGSNLINKFVRPRMVKEISNESD